MTDRKPLAFYIEDRRYGVPNLQFITVPDGDAALVARRLLDESPDHQAVEVRDDDRLLVRLTREAVREAA